MSEKVWRWQTEHLGSRLYFAFSNGMESLVLNRECDGSDIDKMKPMIEAIAPELDEILFKSNADDDTIKQMAMSQMRAMLRKINGSDSIPMLRRKNHNSCSETICPTCKNQVPVPDQFRHSYQLPEALQISNINITVGDSPVKEKNE